MKVADLLKALKDVSPLAIVDFYTGKELLPVRTISFHEQQNWIMLAVDSAEVSYPSEKILYDESPDEG